MGSRLHGNDGGGWLVSLRRTYRRADTWVRPYGWSHARPTRPIPHPHRAGEGGFQTRPYRRERLPASTIAYRRADTWVRPYGWSRAHPPHRIPLPRCAGEGGFRTRPYRRERLPASTIAYRRADTWVRPYGWSRAHPPHRIPHPRRAGEGGFQTRPYGSRATRCGVAPGSHPHSFGGTQDRLRPLPARARQGRGGKSPLPHTLFSCVVGSRSPGR